MSGGRGDWPTVSVIIVSDYAAGDSKGWDDLHHCLDALAHQDFAEPAEIILSENTRYAESIPPDLRHLLPSLRIVLSDHTGSYALKNHGVAQASADLVAILDADCRPAPTWLTNLVAAFRRHPEAAAISGRTTYEGRTRWERTLALLSRSYLDTVHEGPAQFISNNNAGWKRSVYCEHPLPTDAGPFAARIQSESIRREGGMLRFDPSLRVVHEFEGWGMEADIRRNTGFGTVITRLHDPRLPHAGLIRMGRVAIPAIVAGKTWNAWRDCFRCGRVYGVRGLDMLLALALAPILIALETPGMWAAYGHGGITDSSYR
jgi:glycosyltransferase involved in cell wall biosynthesis